MDRMKSGMEALTKASHKLAEEMYKATQTQAGAQGPQGAEGAQAQPGPDMGGAEPKQDNKPGGDDVIDADFKVNNDK